MSQQYSIVANIIAKTGDFVKGMNNASKQVDGMAKSFQQKTSNIANGLNSVGKGLNKYITLPAVGAATAVAGVTAALGWSRLASIDEAQAQLRGLGYEAEDVERISLQVVNAISDGMTTLDEGTRIAVGALAAGVEEGEELERYIRLVGDAAAGSNRTVDEMAQVFNRVQGSGRIMTQELNMIEQSMPGFANALAESLEVPPDKMREMVTAGEVSSDQFLDVMENFAGGMAEEYAKSWRGMVQNTKAFIGIIGESLLSGVFEQSKESIAEFIELLSSDKVQTWAAETGEKIGEAFTNIVEGIKSAISWFINLEPETQKFIGYVGAAVVAAGPFFLILSKVLTVVSKLTPLFAGIGKIIMTAFYPAIKVVGAIMTTLSIPVLAVVAGIAALAGMFIYAYQTSEEFRETVHEVLNAVKEFFVNAFETIVEFFQEKIEQLKEYWEENGEQIKERFFEVLNGIRDTFVEVFTAIVEFFQERIEMIREFWDEEGAQLQEAFANIWEGIKFAVGFALEYIQNLIEAVMPYITDIFSAGWEIIKTVFDTALGIIMGFIQTFSGLFTGDWEKMMEGIDNIISSAWEGIKSVFETVLNLIVDLASRYFSDMWENISKVMDKVKNWISEKWDETKDKIRSVLTEIYDNIAERFSNMREKMQEQVNQARERLEEIWDRIRDRVTQIASNLRDKASEIFQNLRERITTAITGLRDRAVEIWDSLRTGVTSIISSLRETASEIFQNIRTRLENIVNSIKTSIENTWSDMTSAVGDTITGLRTTLTNTFNSIRTRASNTWNRIKDAITKPIDEAKDTISGIIDTITGFFDNMSLSIPRPSLPKMPRFTISGSFGFNPPSVPSMGIEFYRQGGLMTRPTAFGMNGNNLMVGGEQPGVSEAILPLTSNVLGTIGDKIYRNMSGTMGTVNNTETNQSNSYNINVNIENVNAKDEKETRDVADQVATQIMDGLKKRGG